MEGVTDTDRPLTLREWAQGLAPGLDVVSASGPEAALEAGDLVAIFPTAEAARSVVLSWERIEAADAAVGFIALGTAPDRQTELDRPTGVDPEGVAGHTARRVLKGALPGAFVGAAAVGTTVAITSGSGAALVGAGLGGAAFGAVAGGVMAMVKGTGWGEAYQHSFVDPGATEIAVASFHSEDADHLSAAEQAAAEHPEARLARVTADGRVAADRSTHARFD
ncbi:MAG TPA: hypothetical protein VNQ73_13600 [Ilumatobacter sp.]|nr:hypothetical protein [Ilumatobacter sp.]